MITGRRTYRRHLPHHQSDGRTYFITFVTRGRHVIPPALRSTVLQHIVIEHLWRAFIQVAVVMPDHVRVLLAPLMNSRGETYALAQITRGMKGSSARAINFAVGRRGSLWQHESLDHELRRDVSIYDKAEYICTNPVRKGLCSTPDEYPWLWREWIEGQRRTDS